ncbi:hypothetical protein C7B67_08150 [filamentous cyanobacterium Phorm 6]|nr:hypothetical protein C7B67_08150 [filamentous cyanobacterium Phorm 6]
METTEKTLKHHEIYEITEKRVGWKVEKGNWFEIRNIWDYTLAKNEYYPETGVQLIDNNKKYCHDYAFDSYEEALEFVYAYEQTEAYVADVKELEELQRNFQERQRQQGELPY